MGKMLVCSKINSDNYGLFYLLEEAYYSMKEDVESIVNDIKIYADGLILALKNERFKEVEDYSRKMEKHIKVVKAYVKMKKKLEN